MPTVEGNDPNFHLTSSSHNLPPIPPKTATDYLGEEGPYHSKPFKISIDQTELAGMISMATVDPAESRGEIPTGVLLGVFARATDLHNVNEIVKRTLIESGFDCGELPRQIVSNRDWKGAQFFISSNETHSAGAIFSMVQLKIEGWAQKGLTVEGFSLSDLPAALIDDGFTILPEHLETRRRETAPVPFQPEPIAETAPNAEVTAIRTGFAKFLSDTIKDPDSLDFEQRVFLMNGIMKDLSSILGTPPPRR